MKEKVCPRCGARFVCNHDDIANCQCASVRLSEEARRYVAEHYSDCLCAKCLAKYSEE